MALSRRSFQRQVVVFGLVWSVFGVRPARAFRGFGLEGAIESAVAAGMNQAMVELATGLQVAVLAIPLLLIETLLDRFADALKLADDQRQQLKKSREDLLQDLITAGAAIGKRPENERGAAMYAEFERLAPKYRQRMMDILTPEQRQRLEQIERQFQGVTAMLSGDISKQLALTDEQQKTLMAAVDELNAKVRNLRSGNDKLTLLVLTRLFVMRKLAEVKANQVLTTEQQEKWRELAGDPISIEKFIPWDKLLAALSEKKEKAPPDKSEKK